MKIAILGAAGRTGRLAVDYALTQGHEIVAVARQPAILGDHGGLTVVKGDVTDPSTIKAAVAGVDAVLSGAMWLVVGIAAGMLVDDAKGRLDR